MSSGVQDYEESSSVSVSDMSASSTADVASQTEPGMYVDAGDVSESYESEQDKPAADLDGFALPGPVGDGAVTVTVPDENEPTPPSPHLGARYPDQPFVVSNRSAAGAPATVPESPSHFVGSAASVRGGDGTVHSGDEESSESMPVFQLDPEFDVSTSSLKTLFKQLDTENKGWLTAAQVRVGLAHIGRNSEGTLDKLSHDIAARHRERVKEHDFVAGVQDFVAMSDDVGVLNSCCCYDISPEGVRMRSITLDREPDTTLFTDFIREPVGPAQGHTYRWLHICGTRTSVYLRMAYRYNLHQLEMEDILNERELPRVERRDERLHIVLSELVVKRQSSPLLVEAAKLSAFLLPTKNVIVSFERYETGMAGYIANRLVNPGSKIRLNGAAYLLHAMIDTCVDGYFPIQKLIQERLTELETEVYAEKRTSLIVARDIAGLLRSSQTILQVLFPMTSVVSRLSKEFKTTDIELQRYFDDVTDHLSSITAGVNTDIRWAESLSRMYSDEQQHRMNQVMYTLTLVTAMFIPAQFLTGVFGMNMVMPLMEWSGTFALFWAAIVVLCGAVLYYFKRRGWLHFD